jgi:hypothetical protein
MKRFKLFSSSSTQFWYFPRVLYTQRRKITRALKSLGRRQILNDKRSGFAWNTIEEKTTKPTLLKLRSKGPIPHKGEK